MGILQAPTQLAGTPGVFPNFKYMTTTDSLGTITTAGYLNQPALEVTPVGQGDVIQCLYAVNQVTGASTFGIFTVSISGATGTITLVEWTGDSGVILPTVANAIAVFTNTNGTLSDNIVANNVVTASSATPGTIRSIKGLMVGTATTMTSGNLVGVRGEVDMVGASGGFLYGVQGKVIPTGALSGSSWTAGVFGQLDISGATINAGQVAPIWGDYGATSGTLTNQTGLYGVAMTNTTAAVLEGQLYLYGGATNLMYLNTNAGLSGTTYFKAAGTSSGSAGYTSGCNATEVLQISVNGTTYYIPAFAQNS